MVAYTEWAKALIDYKKRKLRASEDQPCCLYDEYDRFSEQIKADYNGDKALLEANYQQYFYPYFCELLNDNKINKVDFYLNKEFLFCIKNYIETPWLSLIQAKLFIKTNKLKNAAKILITLPENIQKTDTQADYFYMKGDFKKAYELSKEVFEYYNKANGAKDEETLIAQTKLLAYYSSVSNVNELLPLEKKLLEDKREIFGELHPETLLSENNYLDVIIDINDERISGISNDKLKEAIDALILKLIDVTGKVSLQVYRARASLARYFFNNDEEEKALKLQNEIYEFYRQELGPNNLRTMNIQTEIVNTISFLGREEIALSLQEQLVRRYKAIFGYNHPNTLDARYNFFVILYLLEDFDTAELVIKALVADFEDVLGRTANTTLNAKYMYARTAYELDQESKAMSILVELEKEKLEPEKRANLSFLMAQVLIGKHDYKNALSKLETLEMVKGENLEFEANEILEMEVECFEILQQYEAALKAQNKLIELLEAENSEEIKVREAEEEKGNITLALNKVDEAFKIYLDNIKKVKKSFGEESMEATHFEHNYSISLYENGNFEEALEIQEPIVKLYKENYGREDELTIQAIINLVLIYKALDEKEKAQTIINELQESLDENKIDEKFSKAIKSLAD